MAGEEKGVQLTWVVALAPVVVSLLVMSVASVALTDDATPGTRSLDRSRGADLFGIGSEDREPTNISATSALVDVAVDPPRSGESSIRDEEDMETADPVPRTQGRIPPLPGARSRDSEGTVGEEGAPEDEELSPEEKEARLERAGRIVAEKNPKMLNLPGFQGLKRFAQKGEGNHDPGVDDSSHADGNTPETPQESEPAQPRSMGGAASR